MTHRLTTNYAKKYCNRTLIVKVIVENVVTCFFWGHGVVVQNHQTASRRPKFSRSWGKANTNSSQHLNV